MKIAKAVIYLTVLLLIISTLATLKLEAASDGFDQYGFPLTFYDSFSGKCDNCYRNFGFKPLNLFLDFLSTLICAYIMVRLKSTFSKKQH